MKIEKELLAFSQEWTNHGEGRLSASNRDGTTLTIVQRGCYLEHLLFNHPIKVSIEIPTLEDLPSYIEAPNYRLHTSPSIFLAGTITGTWDWQKVAATFLFNHLREITVFNPRRKNFNVEDDLDEEQITWEFNHLKTANLILFWFEKETVGPITLFELGRHFSGNIIVGCNPDYPRKKDLEIQMGLARPDLKLFNSLTDVLNQAVQDLRQISSKKS